MSLPWQPVLTRLLPRLRAFPPTLLHSPSRALSTFPPRPSLRPTLLPAQPTSSIISLIRTPFHRPGPQTALHSSRGFFTGAQRGAYYPPNRRADGRRPGWVPETGLVLWKRKFERLPGDWIVWAIIGKYKPPPALNHGFARLRAVALSCQALRATGSESLRPLECSHR